MGMTETELTILKRLICSMAYASFDEECAEIEKDVDNPLEEIRIPSIYTRTKVEIRTPSIYTHTKIEIYNVIEAKQAKDGTRDKPNRRQVKICRNAVNVIPTDVAAQD